MCKKGNKKCCFDEIANRGKNFIAKKKKKNVYCSNLKNMDLYVFVFGELKYFLALVFIFFTRYKKYISSSSSVTCICGDPYIFPGKECRGQKNNFVSGRGANVYFRKLYKLYKWIKLNFKGRCRNPWPPLRSEPFYGLGYVNRKL